MLASIPEGLGTEVAQAKWGRIAARNDYVDGGVPKQKEKMQCRKDKADIASGLGGHWRRAARDADVGQAEFEGSVDLMKGPTAATTRC